MSINYSEIKRLTEAKHDVGNDVVDLLRFEMVVETEISDVEMENLAEVVCRWLGIGFYTNRLTNK